MFSRLSLRSKLITLLLGVSLLASGIMIGLSYVVGVDSISNEVYQRLTSIRNAKAYEIEDYLANLARLTETVASDPTTSAAVLEFSNAYLDIENSDTINCSRQLADFYEVFLDRLARNMEVRRDMSSFYPKQVGACYLQYHYIVNNAKPGGQKDELLQATDESLYSEVHGRYHQVYRDITDRFELYDIFLIDAATNNIVYSVEKEADFGTNLTVGPYRNSNLSELVDKVRRNVDLKRAQTADFAFYRPSYGAPAAFMGAPILRDNNLIGVLAIQLSVDRINSIMNYGGEWGTNGLGQSGEALLVGSDHRLRSTSRNYLQSRESYLAEVSESVSDPQDQRLLDQFGPIMVVGLETENIEQAIRGKQGVMEIQGYQDQQVLSAYMPLELPGDLSWVLATEIDQSEAMAPVARFQRLNLSALAFIIALTTVLAMLLTRLLVRPIDRLTEGAEAVRGGDTSVRLERTTEDELGRLTDVFNSMVASIDEQKEEIRRQVSENENLLYSRFPAAIAERYRNGEQNIVDTFEGVTVISCDLRGSATIEVSAETETWGVVQELSEKFSRAAESVGIEVIHPVPDGYLGVCGMNIPRLDNGRRVVIFAMELREIVRNVNRKHNLDLVLNVGLAQGTVMAGILLDEGKNYVIWGATVDEAQRLSAIDDLDHIFATDPLVELLQGNFAFEAPRRVEVDAHRSATAHRFVGRVADLEATAAAEQTKAKPA